MGASAIMSGRGGARHNISLLVLSLSCHPPPDCSPTHRSAPTSSHPQSHLTAMATVSAALAPSPGFCVKSVTLAASDCSLTPPPPPAAGSAPERLVLPTSGTKKTIPKGTKVFVNIAYDANVPPPPDSSEDAIQRAMRGDELPEGSGGGWFVPLVVPAPREDTDKGWSHFSVRDGRRRTLRASARVPRVALSPRTPAYQWGCLLPREDASPTAPRLECPDGDRPRGPLGVSERLHRACGWRDMHAEMKSHQDQTYEGYTAIQVTICAHKLFCECDVVLVTRSVGPRHGLESMNRPDWPCKYVRPGLSWTLMTGWGEASALKTVHVRTRASSLPPAHMLFCPDGVRPQTPPPSISRGRLSRAVLRCVGPSSSRLTSHSWQALARVRLHLPLLPQVARAQGARIQDVSHR